jgi:hypothetical protein
MAKLRRSDNDKTNKFQFLQQRLRPSTSVNLDDPAQQM